ncbi:YlbD family protein [Halalkalibacterium halodurans]|uniref:BH2601 protein n=1 Tax=Halalkalibacterium halodurans (strain ATCC BAA-125 / DSM 18197 / FERM 7344 / JCM 9153 / C-125) TaxID=272558 RepID=Q9K9P4_HALH5|nr:YlbD family protein [Halalkalibacterium halodurans]MDY7223137.1 YlbD family protein [Halalkalibacterium halodurans]MDY7242358.1 YlbD family protein [Halalkalibacterium halodurans]MED4079745.1 YlbD family protein [Halalkalibacterium halodurans]MED4086313.1 YlbD family protein [Halalkalibacterium halodurans]MED4103342.1 YlbD family protein [Halalkalibacterium halodurans]
MSKESRLHPSVAEFKKFVQEHPLLIREIKQSNRPLQEVYEEWMILGEDHEKWKAYKKQEEVATDSEVEEQPAEKTGEKQESTGQLLQLVKNINMNELQGHLAQFSEVIGNVQKLIQSFQQPGGQGRASDQDHPFSFRRD